MMWIPRLPLLENNWMAEETIEISGTLDSGDARRYALGSSFSFLYILYFFVAFTLFGWAAMIWIAEKRDFLFPHFIGIGILAFIFTVLQSFIFYYYSMVEGKKLPQPLCRYTISNDGIAFDTGEYQGQIMWEYFLQADENDRYFTLSMKGGYPLLVPKSFFTGDEQCLRFKKVVNRKLQAKAHLKG
jgi:hypothetical protein